MTLEGTQLGRYRIGRLLGSGGMGEVYLAEDPRIGQQVAIKVMRSELTLYPNAQSAQEAARLFQREARAIGKLDHPQVLPLHDYGEAQIGEMTLVYLVMPYRPEGSLIEWLRRHYPRQLPPPPVVAHVVSQAASALQHAHTRQITHQDVKPSNFLIRANEKTPALPDVLLADFGIARIATSTTSSSQNPRGTPAYMAPEQTLGEAVPASDQYALAVMAYELLTGRLPFQGNGVRLMYQHLHALPEPPSAHNPAISQALDDVVLTALSKQPEERFVSVTAFAAAFQNAVQAMEVADAPTQIRPPAEESTRTSSGWMPEDTPTPFAQGWAASHPGPTGQPLAETIDLRRKKRSGSFAPSSPQGWREETRAPTSPLPDRLSLGGAVREKELVTPSQRSVARRRSSKGRFILIVAAILVILALVGGGGAYVTLGASATVTITPSSKEVSNTYPITAVTGTPDASKQQVGARLLSVTTPAQTKTVNATGQENLQATHASGMVDIGSNDPSALTFTAGETFLNEIPGCPNISMVLDANASLPPVPVNTGTQIVSIPGHILQIGPIGNISEPCFEYDSTQQCSGGAGSTYTCYWVHSGTSFTGGQDAYNGPVVQQSDIDGAVSRIAQPDPMQVLQPQIKPNEHLVGTPQCTPNVTSDHKAGDRVARVNVSVTFTCAGEVYDHAAAVAMASNLLTQQAATDPGAGYALVGHITTAITKATVGDQNAVALTVSAEGVWAYQFAATQKQALARLIAGKSTQEAQQLLASQPHVAKASISLSVGIGQTLPSDLSRIKIVVQVGPRA